MLTLIVCLAAPVLLIPALVWGGRHLFATFVREASELFLNLQMHKDWSLTIGLDLAIVNTGLFILAWWAAVAFNALEFGAMTIVAPFLVVVALALMVTSSVLKTRLKLPTRDAWLVGLLSFAGGNLPLIVAIPLLLMLVMGHEPQLYASTAD